eukprot:TRINITY_DN4444_c0_g1_i4.p1 TRINITY_DN4444_c0_g1~~TRINITY_DN4444_c0_g1_i4.p1  ORF type:complete len:487 (+),score=39.01 TRINITY_DN4444_c0_g1_i4:248-1708(+)
MAVKHIDKKAAGDRGLREVFSEVEILSLLRHPNIIRLEEIYEDSSNLWLVMDLVEGGELEQELKKHGSLRENIVKRITKHVLLALEYLHGKGIVHRDLKLANMLVSGRFEEGGNCDVKIADFGFSCVVSNESTLTSFCGTTVFMAPEILMDLPYGKPVDMWAVGVITYLLLFGHHPFVGPSESQLITRICNIDFSLDDSRLAASLSKPCKDFISQLIILDVHQRLSATEALHHAWLRGDDLPNYDCDPLYMDLDCEGLTTLKVDPKGKFLKCITALMALNRLIYYNKSKKLAEEDCKDIQITHDFSYLVSGRFEPKSGVVAVPGMVGPKAVQRLCDMVEAGRDIGTWNMSGNNLSYEALQMVVKVAANHPKLTDIDLSNNIISSTGARAILRLARSGTLREIHLVGTTISADLQNQIDSALKEARAPRKPHRVNRVSSPAPRSGKNNSTLPSIHSAVLPKLGLPTIKSTRPSAGSGRFGITPRKQK